MTAKHMQHNYLSIDLTAAIAAYQQHIAIASTRFAAGAVCTKVPTL
jgi:hypothetical protein